MTTFNEFYKKDKEERLKEELRVLQDTLKILEDEYNDDDEVRVELTDAEADPFSAYADLDEEIDETEFVDEMNEKKKKIGANLFKEIVIRKGKKKKIYSTDNKKKKIIFVDGKPKAVKRSAMEIAKSKISHRMSAIKAKSSRAAANIKRKISNRIAQILRPKSKR